MAHKMLLTFVAVLLAATAAQGRSLRAEDASVSATAQLGAAASEGAGGDSSSGLKEAVAAFYLQVQGLAQKIVDAGANKTDEYQVLKQKLDTVEYLWRAGDAASLEKLPAQLGSVSNQAETFAAYAEQQAASLEGDEKQKWTALAAALNQLAQSAESLQAKAKEEALKAGLQAAQQAGQQAAQQAAQQAIQQGQALIDQGTQALSSNDAAVQAAAQKGIQMGQQLVKLGQEQALAAAKGVVDMKLAELKLAMSGASAVSQQIQNGISYATTAANVAKQAASIFMPQLGSLGSLGSAAAGAAGAAAGAGAAGAGAAGAGAAGAAGAAGGAGAGAAGAGAGAAGAGIGAGSPLGILGSLGSFRFFG